MYSRETLKGFPIKDGALEPPRADRSAPRDGPYQRNFPSCPRGPSHTLRTTSASASVKILSPTLVPIRPLGSYLQRLGSSMTPSKPSHEVTAATVTASSFDLGTKL